MASPRITQAGTARASRTFGKQPKEATAASGDELKALGRASSAKHTLTRKPSKNIIKSPNKLDDQHVRASLDTDPYSLSDLDDQPVGSMTGTVRARKRKRSSAPDEKMPAGSQTFQAKPPGSMQSRTQKPAVRKADQAPKGPIPISTILQTPKQPRSRSSSANYKQPTPPRKQPRLIDALAAQKASTPDSDPETETASTARGPRGRSRDLDDEIRSLMLPSTATAPESRSPAKTYTPRTTDMGIKSTKIKYTYSQASRSMAPPSRERPRVGPLPEELDSDSIPSSPLIPGADPFDLSEPSDVEDDKRLVIKSVHELRRAGANNRFSDELEDLLSRIGRPSPKPSTLRRNALLELSQKLQRKDFASQFRDHTDRDSIAQSVGIEEDVISGFALSAVLVQFLSDRPAPHLLHKLALEGIGYLLGRLLLISDDIDTVASLKATNLSKNSRLTLRDIKSRLLALDLWFEHTKSDLSPRTLALKLLAILYQSSTWDEASIISAACLDEFSRAAAELMEELHEPSKTDVDFSLLVSVMESQSNVAREMDQEVAWLRRQSSNARLSLQRVLQDWPVLRTVTRLAALRMAINVTNTNEGASAFDDGNLLSVISDCICSEIGSAREAAERNRLDNVAYESLLLVLGVMINIMEHCPAARHSVDSSSIRGLATLYIENRIAVSEADSEEKSKFSVAFGYLAVLLGYLSLSEPGLTVMRTLQSGQGLRKLLGSIRDFIDVYKNVDSKVHGLEGLVSELQTQLV